MIREFVEGRLIMNERDVATPAAAGNGSHISIPYNIPSTPHVRHHHRPPLQIFLNQYYYAHNVSSLEHLQ